MVIFTIVRSDIRFGVLTSVPDLNYIRGVQRHTREFHRDGHRCDYCYVSPRWAGDNHIEVQKSSRR